MGLPAVTSADTPIHCVLWASQPSNICVLLAGVTAFLYSSVLGHHSAVFSFPLQITAASFFFFFFFFNDRETNSVLSCQKTQARDSLPGAAESYSHPHPTGPSGLPSCSLALLPVCAMLPGDTWYRGTTAEIEPGSSNLPTLKGQRSPACWRNKCAAQLARTLCRHGLRDHAKP